MEDSTALLGSNGNGKSTMAKLLAGRLKPMAGEMRASRKLKVGYFAQHQTDELDLDATPLLQMERAAPNLTAEKCRAHIARFGLDVQRAQTPIGNLSGGEKARLLLGLATFHAPNMIILDEPTNHLDIDSRAALAEAINEFPGAVIMVSHDRYLIEACADRLWVVAEGRVREYDGDLDDYRRDVLSSRGLAREREDVDVPQAGRRGAGLGQGALVDHGA